MASIAYSSKLSIPLNSGTKENHTNRSRVQLMGRMSEISQKKNGALSE